MSNIPKIADYLLEHGLEAIRSYNQGHIDVYHPAFRIEYGEIEEVWDDPQAKFNLIKSKVEAWEKSRQSSTE